MLCEKREKKLEENIYFGNYHLVNVNSKNILTFKPFLPSFLPYQHENA